MTCTRFGCAAALALLVSGCAFMGDRTGRRRSSGPGGDRELAAIGVLIANRRPQQEINARWKSYLSRNPKADTQASVQVIRREARAHSERKVADARDRVRRLENLSREIPAELNADLPPVAGPLG